MHPIQDMSPEQRAKPPAQQAKPSTRKAKPDVKRATPTVPPRHGWRTVLYLLALLSGTSHAGLLTLDTSSLAGTAARLEINLLDGDGIFSNSTASTLSQSVTDPGQILHDFVAGNPLSFHLDFLGAPGDVLILNLLDAASNFSLVETDLDALDAEVPYQDALLVCAVGTGRCTLPTAIDGNVSISFVPEPGTLALTALGLPLLLRRRSVHRHDD